MGKRERKGKRRSSSTVNEDERSWVMITFWAVVALVSYACDDAGDACILNWHVYFGRSSRITVLLLLPTCLQYLGITRSSDDLVKESKTAQ